MATKTYTIGTATITATSSDGGLPTFVIRMDGKTSPVLSYIDMLNSSTGGASLFDAAGELIPGWALAVGNQSSPPKWRITTSNPNTGEGQYNTVFGALSQTASDAAKYFKEQAQVATPTPAIAPAPTPTAAPKPAANVTNVTNTTATATTPILKTKPDPIAVTADVDPLTGRAEPISVTSGDPSLRITDEPLITNNVIDVPISPLPDFASDEAAILSAESQATAQDQANFAAKEDWRVRLSLAPDSQYLYNAKPDPGILRPLLDTDGVIFPYTPSISVNYAATYEQTNLVHSNYKIFQYSGSGVDSVSLACAFTAQDTYEANYLLAVIHFFRSMTKMFYGQDDNPKNGTPPPLCYMFGMGGYQFAAHPLAIQGFSYTLPDDVDYIKTTSASPAGTPRASSYTASDTRLAGTGLGKGGTGPGPNFSTSPGNDTVTWVPTRIQMTITCVPIMSRNSVSNRFSLRDYASGKLLNGTREPGGGMW